MMHRAWSSIVEVPYCFSRSYLKFQGHTALKIVKFDPNWAFPVSNSSLNSPMAMICCTKLETAKERCPIVFQGHLKFQGHTGQNFTDFDPNWAFPDYRPVAAFKSLRFALLFKKMHLKMSSAKWWPCCLSLNVLKAVWHCIVCCTLPFAKWQEYWGGPGAMLGILLASSIRWTGHKFRYDFFYWISCIVYLVVFYLHFDLDGSQNIKPPFCLPVLLNCSHL